MERTEVYPVYIEIKKEKSRIIIPDFAVDSEFDSAKTLVKAIESARVLIEKMAKTYADEKKELPVPGSAVHKKTRNQIMTYVDADLEKYTREPKTLKEMEELDATQTNAMWDVRENVFEFLQNHKVMAVTLTQKKYINKVRAYAERYPDEVRIERENKDGSIYAKLPTSYLKIIRPSKGRVMTEEEKAASRERLLKWREENANASAELPDMEDPENLEDLDVFDDPELNDPIPEEEPVVDPVEEPVPVEESEPLEKGNSLSEDFLSLTPEESVSEEKEDAEETKVLDEAADDSEEDDPFVKEFHEWWDREHAKSQDEEESPSSEPASAKDLSKIETEADAEASKGLEEKLQKTVDTGKVTVKGETIILDENPTQDAIVYAERRGARLYRVEEPRQEELPFEINTDEEAESHGVENLDSDQTQEAIVFAERRGKRLYPVEDSDEDEETEPIKDVETTEYEELEDPEDWEEAWDKFVKEELGSKDETEANAEA